MNVTLIGLLTVAALAARDPLAAPQDDAGGDERSATDERVRTPNFGGPNSPAGQLEESRRERKSAFRFPAIDEAFDRWDLWKERQDEEHGLQISGHYTTLSQWLRDTPAQEDHASSGVLRLNLKWDLVRRGDSDTGSLVVTADHRHAFADVAPAGLGGEAGYVGQTGVLYSDVDFVVPNLNWQQSFDDRRAGIVVGRLDPSDYLNVLGYSNPWTTFSNLAILLEPSVAFPDASWGVGGGRWFTDQLYALGGLNDANGTITDDFEFFEEGSEFFTWAQAGWSPSQDERYVKNVHLAAWHVDERDHLGLESSHGVSVAANWTFDEEWMPFARAGTSSGDAALYDTSFTLGVIKSMKARSDLIGAGVNWGEPAGGDLDDQTTWEAFWRVQLSQNLAFTPSVQVLEDPALDPESDTVYVLGLRARLTF